MFNLGFGEILVICVVLIIVVGPERLPAVMKNVGKALRTVRQASREIQTTVGLDELWREDVLASPPPRVPPASTLSRPAEQIPAGSAEAVPQGTPELPVVGATPSTADAPAAAPAAAPTVSEAAPVDARVTGSGGTRGDG